MTKQHEACNVLMKLSGTKTGKSRAKSLWGGGGRFGGMYR